jgi:hypothetical protein
MRSQGGACMGVGEGRSDGVGFSANIPRVADDASNSFRQTGRAHKPPIRRAIPPPRASLRDLLSDVLNHGRRSFRQRR